MNFNVRVRVVVCLTFWAVLASGQGPRIHSEYGPLAGPDGDLPRKRELWVRHGRVFPGQSPAALRYRAHRQKMQQRAAKLHANAVTALPHDTSTTTWTP